MFIQICKMFQKTSYLLTLVPIVISLCSVDSTHCDFASENYSYYKHAWCNWCIYENRFWTRTVYSHLNCSYFPNPFRIMISLRFGGYRYKFLTSGWLHPYTQLSPWAYRDILFPNCKSIFSSVVERSLHVWYRVLPFT